MFYNWFFWGWEELGLDGDFVAEAKAHVAHHFCGVIPLGRRSSVKNPTEVRGQERRERYYPPCI